MEVRIILTLSKDKLKLWIFHPQDMNWNRQKSEKVKKQQAQFRRKCF